MTLLKSKINDLTVLFLNQIPYSWIAWECITFSEATNKKESSKEKTLWSAC